LIMSEFQLPRIWDGERSFLPTPRWHPSTLHQL
jgi:hypothetical protein